MAELSRSDDPLSDPEYPQASASTTGPVADSELPFTAGRAQPATFPGAAAPDRLLPEHEFSSNPRLNRSAELLGRGVGTAVSTVKHLPQRVGHMKSRLQVVGGRTRQNASAAAMELVDNATQRASGLRDSAASKVSQWGETASARTSELADLAHRRMEELRRRASWRAEELRRKARQRVLQARSKAQHWQREYPLETIAAFGAAAFVIGMTLRIWRSNSE